MNPSRLLRPLVVALAAFAALRASALEITLPPETARLTESPLPGYPLALALCATCHSAEYMAYQPTLPRTYWQATVTKMQKTFGAPIPDNAIDPLVDYLTKTYGAEKNATSSNATATPPKTAGAGAGPNR